MVGAVQQLLVVDHQMNDDDGEDVDLDHEDDDGDVDHVMAGTLASQILMMMATMKRPAAQLKGTNCILKPLI